MINNLVLKSIGIRIFFLNKLKWLVLFNFKLRLKNSMIPIIVIEKIRCINLNSLDKKIKIKIFLFHARSVYTYFQAILIFFNAKNPPTIELKFFKICVLKKFFQLFKYFWLIILISLNIKNMSRVFFRPLKKFK